MATPLLPPKKYTIPVFTFFSLCGLYFIVIQMVLSHAPDRFLEVHKASDVPLSLSNHTLPLLDKILTPLISFFVAAFGDTSSTAYPTVVHFVWSFGCAIQVPLIEGHRDGVEFASSKSLYVKLLAFPSIWGILYQRLSGGMILPLWLLVFMLSSSRAEGSNIKKFKAESVLFGWWTGHSILALIMLIPGQPALQKAPLWIGFPIFMSVMQWCYLKIRESISGRDVSIRSHESGSVQLLYLSGFVGAFMAHVHLVIIPGLTSAPSSAPTHKMVVNKLFGLMQFLLNFFTPATGLHIPTPEETTASSGVVHFVQFDVLVVFAAMWTALIWDLALGRRMREVNADTCRWVAKLVIALLVGALALSPGAVTSLLLLYREKELRRRRSRRSTPMLPHDDLTSPEFPSDPPKLCV